MLERWRGFFRIKGCSGVAHRDSIVPPCLPSPLRAKSFTMCDTLNHNSEAMQGGAHSPEVLAETRKHLELAALLPRRPGLSGCVQPCL